ncbi:MAG TPA: CPBP family intramembrane glutamic endopeptidase [Caulobacteraceae bacterium]|nr:CPBP family intramembrane glutamic endopeptidase [Caulobacteraceae bacterium]
MREGRIDLAELGQSAFLADVGPSDRNILRLVLGLMAGIVASFAVLLVILVLAGVGWVLYEAGKGVPMGDIQSKLGMLTDPNFKPTYGSTLAIMAFLAAANGTFFGGIVVILALINRRKLKSYVTAARRFRWRMLGLGLAMFTLVVGPVLVLDVLLSGKAPELPLMTLTQSIPQRAIYVVVALVCLTIAAGVEELLCRGWLLKQTAAWTRNFWILAIVNGLLFSLMHLPDIDPNAFIGRALMGMGFVYMTLRTGGIEFSTGAHAANNLLLILFVQTPPMGVPPPEKFNPVSVLPTVLAVLAYVLIAEIVARWRPLRDWGRSVVELAPEEAEAFA